MGERSSRNLQLWPGGESVTVMGEYNSTNCRVKSKREDNWEEPTMEMRRKIHIEELAEMYVERDVLHCDSSLVSDLIEHASSCNLASESRHNVSSGLKGFDYENVQNLCVSPENWYVEECKDWLEEHGYDIPDPDPWGLETVEDLLEALNEDPEDPAEKYKGKTVDELRAILIEEIDEELVDGLEDYRDAVRDNSCDHQAEIYEWWRVNEWLAKKLIEAGECVLDNDYGYWWGRCCTGQGMIMDGTFQRIAARFVDEKITIYPAEEPHAVSS
jgi:hypothetical protein